MNKISNMPKTLGEFINAELHHAELYRALSKSAPNARDREILEEFSDDCQDNADELMRLYKRMTGYKFEPRPSPVTETGSYRTVLRSRIRNETRMSKKYRREYMNTSDNLALKRAFFNAYHNSLEHAVGIIDLLNS